MNQPNNAPARRPINLQDLDHLAAQLKLKQNFDSSSGQAVNIGDSDLIPCIQADVGNAAPTEVYRYRLYIPMEQIVHETLSSFRTLHIATKDDVEIVRSTFLRHFGGVTMLHGAENPALGGGARDPKNIIGSQEENEHTVFEVYAAPLPISDDYFRKVRKEIQDALQEGVILVERQRVTLI